MPFWQFLHSLSAICALQLDSEETRRWWTEEEKAAFRARHGGWEHGRSVGFDAPSEDEEDKDETVKPRAGAGLSEDEALAARFGEAASLDEL